MSLNCYSHKYLTLFINKTLSFTKPTQCTLHDFDETIPFFLTKKRMTFFGVSYILNFSYVLSIKKIYYDGHKAPDRYTIVDKVKYIGAPNIICFIKIIILI